MVRYAQGLATLAEHAKVARTERTGVGLMQLYQRIGTALQKYVPQSPSPADGPASRS